MLKSCANSWCQQSFEVTSDDLAFYEKVSPVFNGKKELIPPPTLCPDCRVQRRMAWRNDRTFYHRKCDFTGEKFISMYAPDSKFPVYKPDAWHGDGWDGLDYGRPFDFSRPFFVQWSELRDTVPHWGVAISNCENSDFCNYCTDEKNCYLDIAAEGNENCYYNLFVKTSKDCVDCTFVYSSTLCYECIQCYSSYGLQHCQYMDDCSDCSYCFDCKGCRDCLLCINQRNKQYCVMNEQCTKEEYEKKRAELRLDSSSMKQQVSAMWKEMRIRSGLYRDMYNLNSEHCTGGDIKNSKNCASCFNVSDSEDCEYLYDVLTAKDCRDMNYSLYDPEADYEVISTVGLKNSAFHMMGPYNARCYYNQMLKSCKDCFGCVGLKQKQYCILNTQYTKEEYEALVPRIIEHMRSTQEWGEFFPVILSPHGYNETVASEYFPLAQDDIRARGWSWRDDSSLQQREALSSDLPDSILHVDDSIVGTIFRCETTGKPYKIIVQELDFYRRMTLPLPRRCPEQRHKDRNALRNPRKLWPRTCATCQKPISTSYSPERPEKVVCEECYLKEVY